MHKYTWLNFHVKTKWHNLYLYIFVITWWLFSANCYLYMLSTFIFVIAWIIFSDSKNITQNILSVDVAFRARWQILLELVGEGRGGRMKHFYIYDVWLLSVSLWFTFTVAHMCVSMYTISMPQNSPACTTLKSLAHHPQKRYPIPILSVFKLLIQRQSTSVDGFHVAVRC